MRVFICGRLSSGGIFDQSPQRAAATARTGAYEAHAGQAPMFLYREPIADGWNNDVRAPGGREERLSLDRKKLRFDGIRFPCIGFMLVPPENNVWQRVRGDEVRTETQELRKIMRTETGEAPGPNGFP
ncbi:MAG: hypothetical protein KGJ96_06225 [Xanthomonadaceae bacterium]|nr:hypothetical protein [Xanthomonadaceae bacterium]